MEQLALIPRAEEGMMIPQRVADGYISATALCQSVGKRYSDYRALSTTQAFINELVTETRLPEERLIHVIKGGNASLQGTWVHPFIAMNLAQWLSPKFAVKVSKWVTEWQEGKAKSVLPAHLERYMKNREKVPYTHFSMLNELTLNLIAPLEKAGYTLPDNLVPDISEGKMFCKWLRDKMGVDTDSFPKYQHEYPDGRVVSAKLYPIEYYNVFKKHFNETWLPVQAPKYFGKRQPQVLQLIETLLLPNLKN